MMLSILAYTLKYFQFFEMFIVLQKNLESLLSIYLWTTQ